jgi:hypothetical protein
MSTAHARARAEVPVDAELSTFSEWLKRFISRDAVARLEQAHSNATVGLFRHAMAVLADLGFDDAIAAVCDDAEVFTDLRRRQGDLAALTEAVLQSDGIYGAFAELRIVAARDDDRIVRIAVVRVAPGPPGAPPKLRFDVAARSTELRAQEGETAAAMRDRVHTWAAHEEGWSGLIADVTADAAAFAERLRARLPTATVESDPGAFEIIALDPVQAGRLRHLGFGEFVRDAAYRAAPSYSRSPPNDGPFDYYLFDPYDALARAFLIETLADGAMRRTDVHLIGSDATPRGTGETVNEGVFAGLEVPPSSIRVEDGELVVDDSIEAVSALDPAEALSEHAPGYGGGEAG